MGFYYSSYPLKLLLFWRVLGASVTSMSEIMSVITILAENVKVVDAYLPIYIESGSA